VVALDPAAKRRIAGYIVVALALAGAKFGYDEYLVRMRIARMPPPVERSVAFHQDVYPVLETYCLRCHNSRKALGELDLTTPASIRARGESGTRPYARASARNLSLQLLAGAEGEWRMPPDPPLPAPGEVALVRAWIEQGMPE